MTYDLLILLTGSIAFFASGFVLARVLPRNCHKQERDIHGRFTKHL